MVRARRGIDASGWALVFGLLLLPGSAAAQGSGSVCDSAAAIGLDDARAGQLEPGDVDLYRFEVAVAQPLLIETLGNTDTVGVLRDSACAAIAESDDEGTGLNFAFLRVLEPGTYYVEVRHFSASGSGPYTLRVTRAIDEAGADCSTARTLGLDDDFDALLVPAGDRDFYRIDTPTAGRLQIGVDASAFLRLTLRDSACNEIEVTSGGLTRFVEAGTYYLELATDPAVGDQLVAYSLSIGFPACNAATSVAVGSTLERTLSLFETEYFRIDLSRSANLRVYTTGGSDTTGRLFGRSCGLIRFDTGSGDGDNFEILRDLPAGVYFVSVGIFSGSALSLPYTLHVEEVPRPTGDVARSCRDAAPLDPGASRSEQLQPEGDVDSYRVEIPAAATLTVFTRGNVDTFGRLSDSRCSTLATEDDGGAGLNFSITRSVEAGTYYVSVEPAFSLTTGTYSVHVETEPPPEGDPGGSCATASSLGLGQTLEEQLFPVGDADFYRIDVASPGTLALSTRGGGAVAGLRLRDAQCVIAQSGLFSDGDGERLSRFVTAGSYYVEVYSASESVVTYSLTSSFDASALPGRALSAAQPPRLVALVVDAPLPPPLRSPGAYAAAPDHLADALLAAMAPAHLAGLAEEVELVPMVWSRGPDAPFAVAELERALRAVRARARRHGAGFAVLSRGWGSVLSYAALATAGGGDPIVPDLAAWVGSPLGVENAVPPRDARLIAEVGEWLDARLAASGCSGCQPAARRSVNLWASDDPASGPLRFDQLPGTRNIRLEDPSAAAAAVVALIRDFLDGDL